MPFAMPAARGRVTMLRSGMATLTGRRAAGAAVGAGAGWGAAPLAVPEVAGGAAGAGGAALGLLQASRSRARAIPARRVIMIASYSRFQSEPAGLAATGGAINRAPTADGTRRPIRPLRHV